VKSGALAAASLRLRDLPGFPKRAGRPRTRPASDSIPVRENAPVGRQQRVEPAVLLDPVPTIAEETPALPPRLLGARDGGAYIGCSAWTLRELVEKGYLRKVMLPGINRLLVDVRDLDELIEQSKREQGRAR